MEQAQQGQKPPLQAQRRSSNCDPAALAGRLQLARNIDPRQVAASKRGPKVAELRDTPMAASCVPRFAPRRCLPKRGQQHLGMVAAQNPLHPSPAAA